MSSLVKILSKLGWKVSALLDGEIRDAFTGEVLGRGWIIGFGCHVYVIGYRGDKPLVPVFLPQEQLRYWRLDIGFTTKGEPDFKNVREDS